MADNQYNTLETQMVTALQADTWLGDSDNVTTIQQKISGRLEEVGEHELPLIGVMVTGGSDELPGDETSFGAFDFTVDMVLEIVVAGADLNALDTSAKRIVAEVRRLIREMKDSGSILSGNAQNIDNGSFEITWFPLKQGWAVTGTTEVIVALEEEN